ncbi:MAG: 50S ribosomal protein L21 [Candidatus Eremiobacteraeota bacterium]|nr:50S ribosomal protein L21 [Candidatus Eremiobacteraeota bacterium]
MYAVVETGGKQVKVSPGDKIRIDRLDVKKGDTITLDKVIAFAKEGATVEVGTPYVEGAAVNGKVLRLAQAKKITSMRYRPKKRIRIIQGHRQKYALLEIASISKGGEVFEKAEKPPQEKPVKAPRKESPKGEKKKASAKADADKKAKKSGPPEESKS